MDASSDSADPPQDVAVTGGTWNKTVMGTQIVDKSTVINNYSQGSTDALKSLPQDAYQLSPGIIVYESNPISPESRIYRAKLLSKVVGDRDIAVKLLPHGKREEREAKIHFTVPHHKNIVERILTDTFKYRGQSTIYIAMERCDDQNMYSFVTSQAKNSVAFDPDMYLSYAKQVATGVAFLHSHKVMNRDLKPSNLLLGENKTVVKIADFGMCKKIKPGLDDVTLTKTHPGTIGWSSPEILNGEERIGLDSDIFLLGLVFYFLWSYGKHPFGDDPHSWNHYIKHNENLRLGGMLIHDKAVGEKLIGSMLQRDPKLRPNADQVLNDRIFKETTDKKILFGSNKLAIQDKISQKLKVEFDGFFAEHKEQLGPVFQAFEELMNEELEKRDQENQIQKLHLPDETETEYWDISEKDIKMEEKLAMGGYSTVWKGYLNKDVIIKECYDDDREFLLNEVKVLRQLQHPNIVKLIGVVDQSRLMLIREYMAYGSLASFLRSNTGLSLEIRDRVNMAIEVASAMSYLEVKKYVFRNLHAQYIAVGKDLVCKLSAFGRAVYVGESGECKIPFYGEGKEWTAPESVGDEICSIKSDVWSFGRFLTDIVRDEEDTFYDAVEAVTSAPFACPRDFYDGIIKPCLKLQPKERPTFRQLEEQLKNYLQKVKTRSSNVQKLKPNEPRK